MCNWCNKFNLTPSNQWHLTWGLSHPMCDASFGCLKDRIVGKKAGLDRSYLDDYARIYSVMLDRERIRKVLSSLGDSILPPTASTSGETKWLRFSSILTHYERKCWFHQDVLLPMGVLKDEDFYHYIRCGYVLKDYGAGVKHGEFTHRLQWHVIMAVATESFSRAIARGWNHSPFELYISLGERQNWDIWGFLLDNLGDGEFTHPDSFHQWLLQEAPPNIKTFLVRRETKRREQFIRDICEYIAAEAQRGVDYSLPDIFLPTQYRDPRLSHEDFKAFDQWFADELRSKQGNDEAAATRIYNEELTKHSTDEYVKRKTTADLTKLDKAPKYRTTPYLPLKVGAVYALSMPVKGEAEADRRAGASAMGLRVN
jgi:hypothetical protein